MRLALGFALSVLVLGLACSPAADVDARQAAPDNQAIINGEAAPLIESYINTAGNKNDRFGLPSAYQAKRSIRFGFRFVF